MDRIWKHLIQRWKHNILSYLAGGKIRLMTMSCFQQRVYLGNLHLTCFGPVFFRIFWKNELIYQDVWVKNIFFPKKFFMENNAIADAPKSLIFAFKLAITHLNCVNVWWNVFQIMPSLGRVLISCTSIQ